MKELIQEILNNPYWSAAIVLVSQFLFIYLRTLNVIYTTDKKKAAAIITGNGVGILTLISFSIGINSVLGGEALPVIMFLIGGSLGTYFGIKQSEKKEGK